MSASDLLAKVDRFLREQTRIDESHKQQTLQLVWQSTPIDPLAIVVASITAALSPPTETFERPEPSQQSLVLAKLSGTQLSAPPGSRLRRIVWNLTDDELLVVTQWLDKHEAVLAHHKASAFVHRHVAYRWLPKFKGVHPEFNEASIFGVCLSHQRHIQVPFIFYDAEHYFKIKQYMAEIGLATLLDESIRPKGALGSGTTGGAV